MLQIDKLQMLPGAPHVAIYGDSDSPSTFYLVNSQPRFSLGPDGKPLFSFVKYRTPIDRQDGSKGGGFAFFSIDFGIPDDQKQTIVGQLQDQVDARFGGNGPDVSIGTISWESGICKLNLSSVDGTFVENVWNPAGPTLFGDLNTPFTVEFTDLGATLFEQIMQGQGGVAQIETDLVAWVKLPPFGGYAWFHASEFYSFAQTIHLDYSIWGETSYQESLTEQFTSSQSMGVQLNFGEGVDDKLKAEIRGELTRELADMVKAKMLTQIDPVSADDRSDRGGDDDVSRNFQTTKVEDFTYTYNESDAVQWGGLSPKGEVPNITTLVDKDGNPLEWSDYARVVDLDDPFFKTLSVTTRVNADFEHDPLFSVAVNFRYDGSLAHTTDGHDFTDSKDVYTFKSLTDDNNFNYTYCYVVNYKNESQTFTAPEVETDKRVLDINVGDAGILDVALHAGNMNFDVPGPSQITSAQVSLRYQDVGVAPIEEQFTLTKDAREATFQHVLFQPVAKPYEYKVDFQMADGHVYHRDWTERESQQLFVNSPFNSQRTVSVRAAGDFEGSIDTIFVDLVYDDPGNVYQQTASVPLNKTKPFYDWTFPMIDPNAGTVSYSGTIKRLDGSVQQIDKTAADGLTIVVGDLVAKFLQVDVVPDLIDFSVASLVKVDLHYVDQSNQIDESHDIVFRPGAAASQSWRVDLSDKTALSYSWKATYYLTDGTTKDIPETTTDDATIVLPARAN